MQGATPLTPWVGQALSILRASLHVEQSIDKKKYLIHLYKLFKEYC
jgi:hypothetical protein